jgi:alkylation response protein AidB-like acyl-CoA dehydrogenase
VTCWTRRSCARSCPAPSAAWLWGITAWSGARAVLHHGNAAQKERYLPAVAAGDLRYVRFVSEWPMSGTKIQKGRLRQRIADELAAASVTEAPRLTRPATQP